MQRVRSEVWGRGVDGLEYVPAGAAFAALSLGFLGDDEVRLFETGPWTRLTIARGHVLVRRKPWTLKALAERRRSAGVDGSTASRRSRARSPARPRGR